MIRVRLDRLLVKKRMSMEDLAQRTGIARKNLWVLKSGRARAIRFNTLEAICAALDCSPGDLLRLSEDSAADVASSDAPRGGPPLEAHDQRVLDALHGGADITDNIVTATGLTVPQTLVALLNLEVAGLAKRAAGGVYSVIKRKRKG